MSGNIRILLIFYRSVTKAPPRAYNVGIHFAGGGAFYAQTMSTPQTVRLRSHCSWSVNTLGTAAAYGLLVGRFWYRSYSFWNLAAQAMNGGVRQMKIMVFKVPRFIAKLIGVFSHKKGE